MKKQVKKLALKKSTVVLMNEKGKARQLAGNNAAAWPTCPMCPTTSSELTTSK